MNATETGQESRLPTLYSKGSVKAMQNCGFEQISLPSTEKQKT